MRHLHGVKLVSVLQYLSFFIAYSIMVFEKDLRIKVLKGLRKFKKCFVKVTVVLNNRE